MPTTAHLNEAREKAIARLGNTAKAGAAGKAQQGADEAITNHFIELLAQVDMLIPEGREKSLVLTKLEEAKMWAVKAIFAGSTNYSWEKH